MVLNSSSFAILQMTIVLIVHSVQSFRFPPPCFSHLLQNGNNGDRFGTVSSLRMERVLSSPPSWFTSDLFASDNDEFLFRHGTKDLLWTEDDLLESFTQSNIVEILDHNVTAITIQSANARPFECKVSPNTLYERWWYEQLFAAIFDTKTTSSRVLIGSSGTSKSTFQFWLLYRILQSFHNGK